MPLVASKCADAFERGHLTTSRNRRIDTLLAEVLKSVMRILDGLTTRPPTPGATELMRKCCAIRVEGKYEPIRNLLVRGTVDPTSASAQTRGWEMQLGWPSCVYFYLGFAHPDFGSIGFAFDTGKVTQVGTVTPFDSGGMVSGRIKPLDSEPPDARCRTVQENTVPYASRESAFTTFLDNFYSMPTSYLDDGPPERPDCYGIFHHGGNERRAWTWEVQLPAALPLHDSVAAWSIPSHVHAELELERLHDDELDKALARLPEPLIPVPGQGTIQRLLEWHRIDWCN